MKKAIVIVLVVVAVAVAAYLALDRRPSGASNPGTGYDPQLEIKGQSGAWSVPLSKLRNELKVQTITVKDPLYGGQERTYEGFYVQDLAAHSHNLGAESIIFHCRDGFSLRMPLVQVRKAGMVLAFRDTSMPEGFPSSKDNPLYVGRRERAKAFVQDNRVEYDRIKSLPPSSLTPAQRQLIAEYETAVAERDRWSRRIDELNALGTVGPFHPKLTRPEAVPELKDWEAPDAVRTIEFEHVVAFAGRDYPAGAPADSKVMRGYRLFHEKCLSCHAINGAGGQSAPELNIPVNVTEYFNDRYLVPFILNARSVRARSMMSVQPDITREKAEDIVAYLKYMKDHKIQH